MTHPVGIFTLGTEHCRASSFVPPLPAKKLLTTLSLNSVLYFFIKLFEVCPAFKGQFKYGAIQPGRIYAVSGISATHAMTPTIAAPSNAKRANSNQNISGCGLRCAKCSLGPRPYQIVPMRRPARISLAREKHRPPIFSVATASRKTYIAGTSINMAALRGNTRLRTP